MALVLSLSVFTAVAATTKVAAATETTTTLTASTTTSFVGQTVTFTATLKSGTTPLSGKRVTIYYYIDDMYPITATANAADQAIVSWTPSSAGQRTFYATFVGDSSYEASTSSGVTINVRSGGTTPTTFNLMPTSQSAQPNANVQIKAYLRTEDTGIGGQTVDLWIQLGTSPAYHAATGKTTTGTDAGW
jgi:Bacterial Ig-like domain (group 3)